jgi:hypothetical protein
MIHGSPPREENLTFLLCELLDANTTSLHLLSYPMSKAKSDLEASDLGFTIDVEFETHEHSKDVESRYSGADLGIVLTVNHPLFGQSRRGILVQAKRLFGNGKDREYGLFSDYRSFDGQQAKFLGVLEQSFKVPNSVFYLWYNPPTTAFRDVDARIIGAYEAIASANSYSSFRREMALRLWLSTDLSDGESKEREWRQTQPALRFSNLGVVLSIGDSGPPLLKAFYDSSLKSAQMNERGYWPTFAPFADFLVAALTNSYYGSEKAEWIRLTEGQKIPPVFRRMPDGTDQAVLDSPPTPRHTLRLTLRSTLPELG